MNKVCKYFQTARGCKHGEFCKYAHLTEHYEKVKKLCKYLQKDKVCKYGCTVKTTMCHKYVRFSVLQMGNGCKHGDDCKYAHSLASALQKPIQEEADEKCIVCRAQPPSATFKHVDSNDSHMCTCFECATELWKLRTQEKKVLCPMCRQWCSKPIRVFSVSYDV